MEYKKPEINEISISISTDKWLVSLAPVAAK